VFGIKAKVLFVKKSNNRASTADEFIRFRAYLQEELKFTGTRLHDADCKKKLKYYIFIWMFACDYF
jgi:hypothetical protein